jgi:pyruvate decarboxylase
MRQHLSIIILWMNKKGYTLDVETYAEPHNRIQNWRYAFLVDDFNDTPGGGRALGLEAHMVGQLSAAISRAVSHEEGLTLVECSLHRDDCSRELIAWGHFAAGSDARP